MLENSDHFHSYTEKESIVLFFMCITDLMFSNFFIFNNLENKSVTPSITEYS